MSITSRGTEFEMEGQWDYIPCLVLENIYSFLTLEDQFHMSLVCRKWSEVFSSPSLRKKFTFDLTKSQSSKRKCPVMKFVQSYSRMFRHVVVLVPSGKISFRIWCMHFIKFFQILSSNSQVISVEFRNLTECFRSIGFLTYGNICKAIANFLGSQSRLKRVEFIDCYFKFSECVELLRKLIENCRETLTHLVLLKFSSSLDYYEELTLTAAKNLPTFQNFPSLKTLNIDYPLVFENMVARQAIAIETVKNCQTLALSKIVLHHNYVPANLRGLTSNDWQMMKKICPDLQVEMNINIFIPALQRSVEFFIVPNMPITRLNCNWLESADDNYEEISHGLLRRLLACQTNDHLESLVLHPNSPICDLASFIPFLQVCKKLKYFRLFVSIGLNVGNPTNGLDLLMESWLDNRPESLEHIVLGIFVIKDKNKYTAFKNLTTKYIPRLEDAGLKIEVKLSYKY